MRLSESNCDGRGITIDDPVAGGSVVEVIPNHRDSPFLERMNFPDQEFERAERVNTTVQRKMLKPTQQIGVLVPRCRRNLQPVPWTPESQRRKLSSAGNGLIVSVVGDSSKSCVHQVDSWGRIDGCCGALSPVKQGRMVGPVCLFHAG